MEAAARIFPRWVLVSVAVLATGFVLFALRGVLTPIFFAFLIAYMLDPVVDRFEAMKLPRAAGIVIVLTVAALLLGAFLLLAVPAIVSDVARFVSELPPKLDALRAEWEPYLAYRGFEIPASVGEALEAFNVDLREVAERAVGPAGEAVGFLVGGTASVVGALAGLLLVPIIAFYFLNDFDRMTAGIGELIPLRVRPFVVDVAREIDVVLGQFIRGQITVMLILAVLYSIGYAVVGVRLALVIGIIAGLLSFIPYLGGAVAIGLALLMCLLDYQGPTQLIWVVVVYAIVQGLEGFVITPKIMGDQVGLSAVWVLIALMIGGELFGFMGVLLAVPAAAVAKILIVRFLAAYRKSAYFLGPAAYAAGDGAGGAFSAMLREEGLPDSEQMAASKGAALDRAAEGADASNGDPADDEYDSEAVTRPASDQEVNAIRRADDADADDADDDDDDRPAAEMTHSAPDDAEDEEDPASGAAVDDAPETGEAAPSEDEGGRDE